MVEDAVALPLSNIEGFSIAWIDKAIDVVFDFFDDFRWEFSQFSMAHKKRTTDDQE